MSEELKKVKKELEEIEEKSIAMSLLKEFKLINKRQFWIILALIVVLVGTNMAWLFVFQSYDYVEYVQDGEGYNNINMNNQGDVYNNNGAASEIKDKESSGEIEGQSD